MKTFDAPRFTVLFEEVRNQLYRLQTHWTLYVFLYGERKTVELLRKTAIVTFGALQELLIEAIYTGTHRLIDAGISRGRRTASMESLLYYLPSSAAPLRRRLQKHLDAVRRNCEQLTEWRNRHVAHRDAATVLREHPSPLERITKRSVHVREQEHRSTCGTVTWTVMAATLLPSGLWDLVEPFLPIPPCRPKGGRPRVSDRACLTGILFILRSGIPWQMLPRELGCGSGMTCWRRLRDWQQAGIWDLMHFALLDWLARHDQIDWSRAVLIVARCGRCVRETRPGRIPPIGPSAGASVI